MLLSENIVEIERDGVLGIVQKITVEPYATKYCGRIYFDNVKVVFRPEYGTLDEQRLKAEAWVNKLMGYPKSYLILKYRQPAGEE